MIEEKSVASVGVCDGGREEKRVSGGDECVLSVGVMQYMKGRVWRVVMSVCPV